MLVLMFVTLVVAVAVFPVAFFAYKEFYVKSFAESYPEFLRPYVDPEPFPNTPYAGFVLVVWSSLGVSWVLFLSKQSLKKS